MSSLTLITSEKPYFQIQSFWRLVLQRMNLGVTQFSALHLGSRTPCSPHPFLAFKFLLKYHHSKEGFPVRPMYNSFLCVISLCFLFFSRTLDLQSWNLEQTALGKIPDPLPKQTSRSWRRYLTAPCLVVLICKMRIIVIPIAYELN